jgi:hypothetical protein
VNAPAAAAVREYPFRTDTLPGTMSRDPRQSKRFPALSEIRKQAGLRDFSRNSLHFSPFILSILLSGESPEM